MVLAEKKNEYIAGFWEKTALFWELLKNWIYIIFRFQLNLQNKNNRKHRSFFYIHKANKN